MEKLIERLLSGELTFENISISILALTFLLWICKRLAESPRGAIEFIDYLQNRRISKLTQAIQSFETSAAHKELLQKELTILSNKKLTGIINAKVQEDLIKILNNEHPNLPIKYFQAYSGRIHKNDQGKLSFRETWDVWVFECFFVRVIATCVILCFSSLSFLAIVSPKIPYNTYPVFLGISILGVLFGVAIWRSSTSRKKIEDLKTTLDKYNSSIA
ncbi:hypothetical protein CYR55_14115 [Chimaeribacter californicus]|uniref:Uncharacterized protein n=1 Tax=Chimaeribacter californicus TaxID=2060067 RepID=A0A2N5E2V7_9GAMM|nr:hypothetical protein [Chimaeribacter californicus]PLR35035.1 hypothetical protein CYR55_14115 [Chimaeribacter californicus]